MYLFLISRFLLALQFPDRRHRDREDDLSFEERHGRDDAFNESGFSFTREPLDEDSADVDMWRECPVSASPPESPARTISSTLHEDLFVRDRDDSEALGDDHTASPMASFWAQRGSPSYSPAPQRSFDWRPSLSSSR